MAKSTTKPNDKMEAVFAATATDTQRIALAWRALLYLGDDGLAEELERFRLEQNWGGGAPTTEVQAARDAQQAAMDAEAARIKAEATAVHDLTDVIDAENPRDAEISPNEQAHEPADRVHGRGEIGENADPGDDKGVVEPEPVPYMTSTG